MKLKFISDGTHRGIKVVHAETGEPVEGVISIVLNYHHKEFDTVTLTVQVDDRLREAMEARMRKAARAAMNA